MANNRLTLRCSICDPLPCSYFGLVKYYPSTGWYINRSWWRRWWLGRDLDRWLDQHRHGKTMWGAHIYCEREQP